MVSPPATATSAIPLDWPGDGPIDLSVHDCPHASAAMEWWYVNAHVSTHEGRPFSLFAAFFRVDTRAPKAAAPEYKYFLAWAIVDLQAARFHSYTVIEPSLPAVALRNLDGQKYEDERAWRALREVLVAGHVPLPD